MTTDLLEMSVNLVTAHLTQNRMEARDVPEFIREIHSTLLTIQQANNIPAEASAATHPALAADPVELVQPPVKTKTPLGKVANQAVVTVDAVEPIVTPAPDDVEAVALEEAAPAETQVASEGELREQAMSNKIAYTRDNNLDDPVFSGLDPWLAARISPNVARKLDTQNPLHPSVFTNHIICLEDGQQVTLLRPHIKKRYDLTESEYKVKWNLPDEYPMAPPEYIEKKRKMALKGGLGRSVRANREKVKPAATAAAKPSKSTKGSKTVKAAAVAPLDEVNSKPRATRKANAPSAAKASGAGSRRKLSLFVKEGQAA